LERTEDAASSQPALSQRGRPGCSQRIRTIKAIEEHPHRYGSPGYIFAPGLSDHGRPETTPWADCRTESHSEQTPQSLLERNHPARQGFLAPATRATRCACLPQSPACAERADRSLSVVDAEREIPEIKLPEGDPSRPEPPVRDARRPEAISVFSPHLLRKGDRHVRPAGNAHDGLDDLL
jgi:hypothetical protein